MGNIGAVYPITHKGTARRATKVSKWFLNSTILILWTKISFIIGLRPAMPGAVGFFSKMESPSSHSYNMVHIRNMRLNMNLTFGPLIISMKSKHTFITSSSKNSLAQSTEESLRVWCFSKIEQMIAKRIRNGR